MRKGDLLVFKKMRYVGLTVILACLWGCNGNDTAPPILPTALPPLPDQHETGGIISELSMPAKELYWQVNELRSKTGLRPLELKLELCVMAQRQVANMMEQGELTHLSPVGLKIDGRLKMEGIPWTVCAENIGRFNTDKSTRRRRNKNLAQAIIKEWQTRHDDRENMLNELCLETGLAIEKDEKTGKWYVTQIFLRRTLFWEK